MASNTMSPDNSTPALEQLLDQQRHLWRGKQWQQAQCPALSSGHPSLDEYLPGGGWPLNSLTEIQCSHWGIGELQLLLPLLRKQALDERWQLWLAPPFIPYAPALQHADLPLHKTLVVETHNQEDLAWSMEQALRSSGCSVLLAWCPFKLSSQQSRRLQLAAEQGECLAFVFNRQHPGRGSKEQSTPSALKLALQRNDQGLRIDILKRRSGWPVSGIQLFELSDLSCGVAAELKPNTTAH